MKYQSIYDFHDRAYVLTIPRAIQRHQNIRKELEGWDLTFINGVDKLEISDDYFIANKIVDLEKSREVETIDYMSVGSMCCAYGHRLVYEDIIRNNVQRAIIFEDDMFTNDLDEALLDNIVKHIPADAQFIYWGYTGGILQPTHRSFAVRKASYLLKENLGMLNGLKRQYNLNRACAPYNKYFDTACGQMGLYAYSVTLEAAKILVANQTPVIYHSDRLPFHLINQGIIKNAYISVVQPFTEERYSGRGANVSLIEVY